jgi:hypothetical protein
LLLQEVDENAYFGRKVVAARVDGEQAAALHGVLGQHAAQAFCPKIVGHVRQFEQCDARARQRCLAQDAEFVGLEPALELDRRHTAGAAQRPASFER